MANIDVYSLTLPNDNNAYWLKDKSLQDAKGAANGIAELDSTGKVPSSQLPSYVDDVIEVANYSHLPITGETGKIYVTLDDNKTYRWSGTGYTEISSSLALGETSSTAYRGDRGKTAYNHATETKLSTATSSGLYKVASTAQGHIASLTAVEKSDITALGIPESDTNNAVTQTATNTNTDYEVLFSATADNTTRTEGARKNSNLKFNPSTGDLKTTKINGVALGDSPKFTDTTYTFTGGTNKFSYTPSGTIFSIDVPITPSIENNITGSGTSGSLAKFNGTNTITDAVALGSDTTKYLRNDGTWQVPPDTTYNDATTSTHGLMSTTDKAKVDKIDENTTSISGNPISITGLKSNQLAVNPVITFEPIQEGSGDPSPSNVRAISGYDKIEVLSCGKNIFDFEKWLTDNGVTYTKNGNSYTFNTNSNLYNNKYYFSKTDIHVTLSSTITIPSGSSASSVGFRFINSNGGTSTKHDNTSGYDIGIFLDWSTQGTITITNPQVEEGQTATTYEPYHKTTDLSEPLPQTVYGGSLDVRTGVLTVDRAIVDLGDLSWSTMENRYYTSRLSNMKAAMVLCLAEKYVAASSYGSMTNGTFWIADYIYIKDSSTPSGKMVYELATPITIQLTPHEISLLKDYAYVSTNGTSIALDYHNGEIATLGDVEQVGETVNLIGERVEFEDVSQYFIKDDTSINSANISAYRIGKMVFISGNFVPNTLSSLQNKLLFNITNDKILPLSANVYISGIYYPTMSSACTAMAIILNVDKVNKMIRTINNGSYGGITNITTNSQVTFSVSYVCQG